MIPLGTNVIIKLPQKEEKTDFGLILNTEDFKQDKGEIVTVAQGVDLKVGDKVIFRRGQDVEIKGEKYLIVEEEDILATYED